MNTIGLEEQAQEGTVHGLGSQVNQKPQGRKFVSVELPWDEAERFQSLLPGRGQRSEVIRGWISTFLEFESTSDPDHPDIEKIRKEISKEALKVEALHSQLKSALGKQELLIEKKENGKSIETKYGDRAKDLWEKRKREPEFLTPDERRRRDLQWISAIKPIERDVALETELSKLESIIHENRDMWGSGGEG